MAPTIRNAVLSDAAGLVTCIDAAYATYKERLDGLPAVSGGIEGDIRDNHVWVADLDGAVVGGLVLITEERVAVLANLAVDPKHSGKGLGRKLIARAERYCREIGIEELRLSTHVQMSENVSLYARLGWRETGRAGNKVHMSKEL